MEWARGAAAGVCGVVVSLSPLPVLWIIARFGVNVPVEDQIDIGAFLVRNHARWFPSLSDLFSQHNESRKVFPRLLFFYLARLTHWNVKAEMLTSAVLACGVVAALWMLARRTAGVHRALPATALAALLVFSPVQYWNWLFGIQVVVFLPWVMLVAALVIATSSRPLWTRTIACALCCFVATYSYANGMSLWVLIAVALFANREDRKLHPMIAWAIAAAASIGAYFVNYERPPVSPTLVSPVAHPFAAIEFVLAFLGHPLSWTDSLQANAMIGGVGVLLVVVLSIRATKAALPWLVFAAYALLAAGATAIGRLGFGELAALEPRYTTFAMPLWIAVVMLAAMQLDRLRVAAAVALVVLHVVSSIAVAPKIREHHRDMLVARASIQLCRVMPDAFVFRRAVYRDPAFAIPVLQSLSDIGDLTPPLVQSPVVRSSGTTAGQVEGILRTGPQTFVIYGWSLLPDGRAADAVLITRDDRIVALSERTIGRADRPGVGWDLPLRRHLVVPGAIYNAYAYNTENERAYRLAGALRFPNR